MIGKKRLVNGLNINSFRKLIFVLKIFNINTHDDDEKNNDSSGNDHF